MTTSKRRPRRSRRAITLALIARDEEKFIEDCLPSARPVVDEIVVIDTGSRDRTVEIARDFGARVKQVAWRDDFSAARNASVAEARGEFLLQLDADERLVEQSREALRRAVRESGKDYWRLKLTNIGPEGPAGETVRALRLFRRTPRFRFIGRIHEQPLLERPDRGASCDAEIQHLGYDPAIFAAKGKQARNRRLIELALAESERTGDPKR